MIRKILFGLILINTITGQSQNLTKNDIMTFATRMLISTDYSIDVTNLSERVNNFQIALIDLPYREFPSILIFKYNDKTKKWTRTFEGLCPGIQDNPSGLLDWHTLGLGFDFMIGDDTVYNFDDAKIKVMIDAMNNENVILIPYQHFIHMHTADSTSSIEFEPYTVDKTKYYDFAIQLFDRLYTGYPKQECTMFDSPKTTDFNFEYIDDYYKITALTDNGQIWIYTFKDTDELNKYLIEKQIIVKNAR